MRAANVGALLLVSLAAACSGGGGGGSDDPGSFTLSATSTVDVRQGGTMTVTVDVTRVAPFSGEITVSLSALPASVTATSATIPESATSATITVSAASGSAQGPATVTAAGVDSTGTLTDDTTFSLFVKGVPGALDTTFDADGTALTPVGTADDFAYGIATQPDGKVIVVGSTMGTDLDFLVLRYAVDGSLDGTFGTGGMEVIDLGGLDQAFAVRVLADGTILVAGTSAGEMAVVRLTASGAPDTSFGGGDGIALVAFSVNNDIAYAIDVVSPSGAILLAGLANDSAQNNFAVAKLNADGTPDTTFGGGTGKYTLDLFGANDIARGIVSLADGTILVAGNGSQTGNADFMLIKLSAAGVQDMTFGTTGLARADFGGNTETLYALSVQGDGKIFAGGQGGSTFDWALARFTPAGVLDTTWATDGTLVVDLTATSSIRFVGLPADGSVVVAGDAGLGSANEFAFGRFDASGVADPAFGTAGVTQVDLGSAGSGAFAATLTADGRMVAAGNASNGTDSDVGIARLWL